MEADESLPLRNRHPPARLIAHYREKVVPALQEKLGMKNVMATPRLEKIVISMGLGKIATSGGADAKAKFEQAEKRTGHYCRAEAGAVQGEEERCELQGSRRPETGLKVTLRGSRMYEFLDRVVSLAIPRVKDFRGLDPNGFDKNGNYNFGFTEQTVFPEVDGASVTFQQGMNITMVTTAKSPDHGRELLKQFGFPFREKKRGKV